MTKARSNAVANAVKGDLTVGSGTNLSGVLGVGNNGETLVADSTTATGLRYQNPVNANPILNSAMQLWQRGTSVTIGTAFTYTADRWLGNRGSLVTGQSVSRQATGDTTNLPNIQYCARVQRVASNTGLESINLSQSFENINSIPYAGKTVTLSGYFRVGANYSGSTNWGFQLSTGTGTDQNLASAGFTGQATPINITGTLTTTWQRFQATATLSSSATQIGLLLFYIPTGTAGAADYIEMTGVQVEVGSVATPFKTYAGTIQGELAACQRYYWRSSTLNSFCVQGWGTATTTSNAQIQIPLPSTMRVPPTTIDWSGLLIADGVGSSTPSAIANNSYNNSFISLNVTATGLTLYRPYFLINGGSTAHFIAIGAEL